MVVSFAVKISPLSSPLSMYSVDKIEKHIKKMKIQKLGEKKSHFELLCTLGIAIVPLELSLVQYIFVSVKWIMLLGEENRI